MPNPFPFSSPALGRNFFGRRSSLESIFSVAKSGGSAALYGPRHIGKSSLLSHAQTRGIQQAHGLDPDKWIIVRVPCSKVSTHVELVEDTIRRAQLALQGSPHILNTGPLPYPFRQIKPGSTPSDPQQNITNLAQVTPLAQHLNSIGGGLLILFDEIESLFNLPDFNTLPDMLSLGAGGVCVLYCLERAPTQILENPVFRDSGTTGRFRRYHSKFFKLLSSSLRDSIRLGPLDEDESSQILLAGFAQSQITLHSDDEELILALGGGHPFLLQAAASVAFQLIARNDSYRLPDSYLDELQETTDSYLKSIWNRLSSNAQQHAMALANGLDPSPKSQVELQELYLLKEGSNTTLFSPLFELYLLKNSDTNRSQLQLLQKKLTSRSQRLSKSKSLGDQSLSSLTRTLSSSPPRTKAPSPVQASSLGPAHVQPPVSRGSSYPDGALKEAAKARSKKSAKGFGGGDSISVPENETLSGADNWDFEEESLAEDISALDHFVRHDDDGLDASSDNGEDGHGANEFGTDRIESTEELYGTADGSVLPVIGNESLLLPSLTHRQGGLKGDKEVAPKLEADLTEPVPPISDSAFAEQGAGTAPSPGPAQPLVGGAAPEAKKAETIQSPRRWPWILMIVSVIIALNYAFLQHRGNVENKSNIPVEHGVPVVKGTGSGDVNSLSSTSPPANAPKNIETSASTEPRQKVATPFQWPISSSIPWSMVLFFPLMGYVLGWSLRFTKPKEESNTQHLDENQAQENLRRALEQPDDHPLVWIAALLEMSSATTLDSIADAKWTINSVEESEEHKNHLWGSGGSELEALRAVSAIARECASATRAPNGSTRTGHLSRSLASVEALDDHVVAMNSGPLSDGFWLVARVWRRIVVDAIEGSAGRANLRTAILTPQVRFGQQVDVVFQVENTGTAAASGLTITLMNPIGADILGQDRVTLGDVAPEESLEAQFTLKPHRQEAIYLTIHVLHWDPLRGDQILQLNERLAFVNIDRPHKRIQPIPYITGKPLEPGQIFVGRQRDLNFVSEALLESAAPPTIMVIGHRRMGKTSILRHIPVQLGEKALCVQLDFQARPSDSLGPLMAWMAGELRRQCSKDLPPIETHPFEEDAPGAIAKYALAPLLEEAGDRLLVLMIDELESLYDPVNAGKLSHRFFENMRSLLQRFPQIALVLAGTYKLAERSASTSSMLFGSSLTRELSFLSRDDISTLLKEPLGPFNIEFAPLAFDKLHQLAGGHPLLSQHLCYHLTRRINRLEINFVTAEDVDAVVKPAIEGASDHLHMWWNDANNNERWVLAALAVHGKRHQKAADLQIQLEKWGILTTFSQVRTVLIGLTKREIIQQKSDMDAFIYRQALLCRWVNERFGSQERRGQLGLWQKQAES